jgi:hypothetical protein
MRIEYLNNKIWKDDVVCVNMLRLTKCILLWMYRNIFVDLSILVMNYV